MSTTRKRWLNASALIWGLLFASIAVVGFLAAIGSLSWPIVRIAGPLWLIGLGVLGLVLGRPQRNSR